MPRSRVNEDNPFGSIGICYFEPLFHKAHKKPLVFVTSNNKIEMLKCYVILYTCTITRAIILDLVKDGYTKTFINSLNTFIASRGCPKNVISDNGKVFSVNETQAFYSNKGVSCIHFQNRPTDTVRPVKWHFDTMEIIYLISQSMFLQKDTLLSFDMQTFTFSKWENEVN